jgi:hypothetical protein
MPKSRPPITAARIISMTELRKLSLRKLHEMRQDEEPLVVRDSKRNQRRFVILDHAAYERLASTGDDDRSDAVSVAAETSRGERRRWTVGS